MTPNAYPRFPAGQRQLFLDDDDVAQVDNLRATFHQPQKRGPVIRREPAIGGTPEIRGAPVWDPESRRWKIWTIAITPEELHGIAGMSGYHESRDGLHWYQPIVRQAEFKGTRENNFVFIPMGDGNTAEILGAVYDRGDPDPERRYKALSFTMAPELAILFATSPDGIVWTRVDIPLIASGDEPNFSFDESNRRFIATVKVPGPYGRSHALTVSEDFKTWSDPQLVFHADEQDQEEARRIIAARLGDPSLQQPVFNHPEEHAVDVYNFAISRYESRYIGSLRCFTTPAAPGKTATTTGFTTFSLPAAGTCITGGAWGTALLSSARRRWARARTTRCRSWDRPTRSCEETSSGSTIPACGIAGIPQKSARTGPQSAWRRCVATVLCRWMLARTAAR